MRRLWWGDRRCGNVLKGIVRWWHTLSLSIYTYPEWKRRVKDTAREAQHKRSMSTSTKPQARAHQANHEHGHSNQSTSKSRTTSTPTKQGTRARRPKEHVAIIRGWLDYFSPVFYLLSYHLIAFCVDLLNFSSLHSQFSCDRYSSVVDKPIHNSSV